MTFWYFMYKAAGSLLTPPGLFAAAAVAGGLFYRIRRRRKDGATRLLFLLGLVLYCLSMPATAKLLLYPLESPYSLEPRTKGGKSPVVLVLAGGIWSADEEDEVFRMSSETTQRFLAGVSAARELGAPLLYSGGYPEKAGERRIEAMAKQAAVSAGFEGELIVEGRSRTTWENFALSSSIIRGRGWDEVLVATSGFHLRRSMRLAEKFLAPLKLTPLSTGRLEGAGKVEATDFLPSPGGLRNTSLAIREGAGLLAYEAFGMVKRAVSVISPARP
ncbi:MAG: YdcF family protein [Aminivibrio sp.]|jgi:uncharacterized SAM-binding protein YcdF (DUF218 family)